MDFIKSIECQLLKLLQKLNTAVLYQPVQSCRTVTVAGAWGEIGDVITEIKWYQINTSSPVFGVTTYYNETLGGPVTGVTTSNSVSCNQNLDDLAIEHQEDGTYDYFAYAQPGTELADEAWKVFRLNKTTLSKTWANGNASYINVATDLTVLTYS